jgi:hypothetical protein
LHARARSRGRIQSNGIGSPLRSLAHSLAFAFATVVALQAEPLALFGSATAMAAIPSDLSDSMDGAIDALTHPQTLELCTEAKRQMTEAVDVMGREQEEASADSFDADRPRPAMADPFTSAAPQAAADHAAAPKHPAHTHTRIGAGPMRAATRPSFRVNALVMPTAATPAAATPAAATPAAATPAAATPTASALASASVSGRGAPRREEVMLPLLKPFESDLELPTVAPAEHSSFWISRFG